MKYPKFSIIIPVYNTEQYIEECLNSIINQSYQRIEIIIIDDGSTDNSLSICQRIAKKDARIKIFTQKNKGVSTARNIGLKKTTGDYILFVDSDDYYESNIFKKIIPFLNEDELLTFGYKKLFLNKKTILENEQFHTNDIKDIEKNIIFNPTIGGYICNKVFSKSIIKRNNISFDSNIHYSEDLQFTLNYIKFCSGLTNISFSPYIYRMRKSSASFNYITQKNASVLDLLSKLIDKYNNNTEICNKLKYEYLINYYRFKKIYDKKRVKKDIIKNEHKIIKENKLNITDKLKYYIVYKNVTIYNFVKKIKTLIEKTYK